MRGDGTSATWGRWSAEAGSSASGSPKYVASRTFKGALPWQNSRLLEGDVASAVAALKKEEGQDLRVIGSTQVVQTLVEHGLADEIRIMLDPVTVGGARGCSATTASGGH